MNLQLAGGLLGIAIHVPLLYGIWNGTVKQSFATYGLWSLLDFIAAYAIWQQDGNFLLAFLYGIGAGLSSLSLLIKKCFSWTWLEWVVLFLVVVCLVIQYTAGAFYAMVASVGSLTVASVPQVIDTYKNPSTTPTKIYAIFCLANLLSLLGAKSFALEQVLYAGSALLLCFVIFMLSLKKEKAVLVS